MAISRLDSISFLHAATPVLAPTMLDAPWGPNLDLLCVQQLGTAPFCENYAKLYFDAKHLEKGLKNVHFDRLDPDYHNIQLLFVNGMSIQPRAFAILLNKVIDLIFSTW